MFCFHGLVTALVTFTIIVAIEMKVKGKQEKKNGSRREREIDCHENES